MDYTQQNLIFKLKKSLRYLRLYGLSRTRVKIKGQYHTKKIYDELPTPLAVDNHPGTVGLIGCGNYAYSNIAYYLSRNFGNVIRACMDSDANRAASLYENYNLAYYTTDADDIFSDDNIDTIYIASNHASHAEYAIAALERNKHVHIEKPHVVHPDQLDRLIQAMTSSSGRVLSVGYNRPHSKIGKLIKKHLHDQDGAMMLNWFVAGHELEPNHWYFHENEGGRVLGNLCHWIDFCYQMVDDERRYPIVVNPTRSEKSDCDIAITYTFGDGSIAAITFSAKGHTFEGVREFFSAHRGNVLISMSDFKNLVVEIVDKKIRVNPMFRDHGHETTLCSSYKLSQSISEGEATDCSADYVQEIGELFLATRTALETSTTISLARSNR